MSVNNLNTSVSMRDFPFFSDLMQDVNEINHYNYILDNLVTDLQQFQNTSEIPKNFTNKYQEYFDSLEGKVEMIENIKNPKHAKMKCDYSHKDACATQETATANTTATSNKNLTSYFCEIAQVSAFISNISKKPIIFHIEKTPRGKYVRYDGILKRLKVYLFGKIFDDILVCCSRNHKAIMTGVRSLFSSIREEFSINVSKHFNRTFLYVKLWDMIEIISYAKEKKQTIERSNIEKLKLSKDKEKDMSKLVKTKIVYDVISKCSNCKQQLDNSYLGIVNDFRDDTERYVGYISELRRQGYNNKYLKQFDEMVSDFDLYMNQVKKKKNMKDDY